MFNPKIICWVCGNDIPEQVAEKLGTPIAELKLSSRAKNCLSRANIETIEQLVKIDIDDLLRVRNMGKVTLSEIINKVRELGFVKPRTK